MKIRGLLRFDIIAAIFGIITGLGAIYLSELYKLNRSHLGFAILFAGLCYLFLNKYITSLSTTKNLSNWQISSKLFAIGSGLFIVILSMSVLIIRNSLYHRSAIYLGFFEAAVVVLILQIILLDLNPPWKQKVLLLQILLMATSLSAGAFYLFPSLSGNDSFYHQRYVDGLITTGFIQENAYSSFPAMHLISGVFSLVVDTPSKNGFYYVSVLYSIALLAVFPIGKKILNARAGLLAAMLVCIIDYQVFWEIQITPMTLAITFFLLVLMALMERRDTQNPREKLGWTIIIILISGVMIFTHTLATLIFMIALLVIMIFSEFANLINKQSGNREMANWALVLLVGVAILSYWMNIFANPGEYFFDSVIFSIKSALSIAELGKVQMVSIAGSLDKWEVLAGEAGWALLLVPALIGVMISLKFGAKKIEGFTLAFVFAIYLLVAYGAGITGVAGILPDRWISFLSILTSLLAALTLSRLLNIRKMVLSGLVLLFLFITSLLLITSPTRAIPDSPLYAQNLSTRPGFFASELSGMDYARDLSVNNLSASSLSKLYLSEAKEIDPRMPDTYRSENLIVLREFDLNKGFFIPFPKDKINEFVLPPREFLDYLTGPERMRVYDNGEVSLFLSSNN
ncbi:MAG TPA: hypothetical protein VJ327_05875 [Patescibacteria group bacterium]|nr:hypothetical protein [Patescibacteria group bacterium]